MKNDRNTDLDRNTRNSDLPTRKTQTPTRSLIQHFKNHNITGGLEK